MNRVGDPYVSAMLPFAPEQSTDGEDYGFLGKKNEGFDNFRQGLDFKENDFNGGLQKVTVAVKDQNIQENTQPIRQSLDPVVDGVIVWVLQSVKSFFSGLFNYIKSWFEFSYEEGERLPAASSAAPKNIEIPQIQVGVADLETANPVLSNSQQNASEPPSFELQTEKMIGQELIRSYVLTAEESKKFADEIVVLQDSLLTNKFREDMGIPLESGHAAFTKDFGRSFNYNINYKKKFFNSAVHAAKSSPESWEKLIVSLRKEMLSLCNENKHATEVLTRYLNQQIGAPLMTFMLGLPLGDKQGKGYFVANSDLDFYLEKREKSDPIKIVVKTYWPSRKLPDLSKIFSLRKELEEGADGVERFAHLASKINCSFELEFNPPKFLFNKSFNETKVSDYFQYMTLTKGLVVEVHRSLAQPSE